MVLPRRIELRTSPLPRGCSTTELRQRRGRARKREGWPPARGAEHATRHMARQPAENTGIYCISNGTARQRRAIDRLRRASYGAAHVSRSASRWSQSASKKDAVVSRRAPSAAPGGTRGGLARESAPPQSPGRRPQSQAGRREGLGAIACGPSIARLQNPALFSSYSEKIPAGERPACP